ncbi:uncharacterized protein LOC112596750 [Melanaphis sacchari]|uniref:uncharacterized protein LOC112596750 n=1 Tax=Melanaphis sacchari TaxID=742174 RepID=UPI000DC14413|nr:uncharacterized protein LOC112596750 [Melanaphis sacchari]
MYYSTRKDEDYLFQSHLNRVLGKTIITNLQKEHGKSILTEKDIKSYVTEYYNEIINFKPEITPMSLKDFCGDRFAKLNAYTRWVYNKIGVTIENCVENLNLRFIEYGYSNVVNAYRMYIKTAELKMKKDIKVCESPLIMRGLNIMNPFGDNIKKFNSPLVEEDIKELAPIINPKMEYYNSNQMKYYDYLLKYIEDNLNST